MQRVKRFVGRIMGSVAGKRRAKRNPLLPFRKFGYLRKIEGTVKLQKICAGFGIPFEPVKVFKEGNRVKVKDIAGADRIILRIYDNRSEYIVKGASPERLKEIASKMKQFIDFWPNSEFMVQRVGLRESIESYGTVTIHKTNRASADYVESPYNRAPKSEFNIFSPKMGDTISMKLEKNRLSSEAREMVNEKIGNPKAYKMIEHVLNHLKENKIAYLMFVRYRGKKPCFYSMTAR